MRKIIFINSAKYTEWGYCRFGGRKFEDMGYAVEAWVTSCERSVEYSASGGMYTGENMLCINNNDLIDKIKQNKKAFYCIWGDGHNDVLFKGLLKYSCDFAIFMPTGPTPSLKNLPSNIIEDKGVWHNIVKKYKSVGLGKTIKDGVAFAYSKCNYEINKTIYARKLMKCPPRAVFAATKYCVSFAETYVNFKIRDEWYKYVHSCDYDSIIENSRKKEKMNEKFIAFCDAGFGNVAHDGIRSGLKNPTYEIREKYFSWLGELFDKLEEVYNVPVYVFGHPHTDYRGKTLCGRKIIFGRSLEYFPYATLFVYTLSTADMVPIYYNVPMLRLYWKELDDTLHGLGVKASLQEQGGKLLALDNEYERTHPKEFVYTVGKDNRQKMINNYLVDEYGEKNKLISEVAEEIIRSCEVINK